MIWQGGPKAIFGGEGQGNLGIKQNLAMKASYFHLLGISTLGGNPEAYFAQLVRPRKTRLLKRFCGTSKTYTQNIHVTNAFYVNLTNDRTCK